MRGKLQMLRKYFIQKVVVIGVLHTNPSRNSPDWSMYISHQLWFLNRRIYTTFRLVIKLQQESDLTIMRDLSSVLQITSGNQTESCKHGATTPFACIFELFEPHMTFSCLTHF